MSHDENGKEQEVENPDGRKVLMEMENPYGTLIATLEQDERTTYLYLLPQRDGAYKPKAVWIRNHGEAPAETDRDAMSQGLPPMLRKDACRHPQGLPHFKMEDLDLVWFQEGDGVALYHKGEIEAIIPPWSGEEGLYGYAREASAQDVGTLPYPTDFSGLFARIEESRKHWMVRMDKDFWTGFRDRLLTHYEEVYGKHTRYFASQGRSYPPLAIVEFQPEENRTVYATLGMSYQNMPGVEMAVKNPQNHVRTEVITSYDGPREWLPEVFAALGHYPWDNLKFFVHGHSFVSGRPDPFSSFLLTSEYTDRMIKRPGDMVVDDHYPVTFLYALPLGEDEIREAGKGKVAEILEKRWID